MWRYCFDRASFLVSSSHVIFVKENRWFWGRAIVESVYIGLKLLSVCKKVRTRCAGSASHKRFLVGMGSPFMRLADHFMALRAWSTRCLPGRRRPDVLHPGIVGARGSIISRPRLCMHEMSTPPPPQRTGSTPTRCRYTSPNVAPPCSEAFLPILPPCLPPPSPNTYGEGFSFRAYGETLLITAPRTKSTAR